MPIEPLHIHPVPILESNYVWILHDRQHAVMVDPGRAEAPLAWLDEQGLTLTALLITHHHWDHTDGIDDVLARHPVPVWGPDDRRIPQITHSIDEGDHIHIDQPDLALEVLDVPGHTSIHLAFVGSDFVLCGDALFSAGCGRMFEGTAGQFQASLDKLAALPGQTRVYCTHEYTQDNCRFAQAVEPDNPHLKARARQVSALRENNEITLPSTIAEEKNYNPFLRLREPTIIQAAQTRNPNCNGTPESVFATLRSWKDGF